MNVENPDVVYSSYEEVFAAREVQNEDAAYVEVSSEEAASDGRRNVHFEFNAAFFTGFQLAASGRHGEPHWCDALLAWRHLERIRQRHLHTAMCSVR